MRNVLVSLSFATAALLSLTAFADIKAFNAAVSKGDYKAASAEAASTWPTLDKSRADIGLIAQEFGYAAFVDGDYTAARVYAEFASTSPSVAADPRLQAVSAVLLHLSDHRLKPSGKTRDDLMAAVTKRAEQPGFDDISYSGADAVVAWDVGKVDWDRAKESSRLGLQFAAAGGAYSLPQRRRMEMLSVAAAAMPNPKANALGGMSAIQEAIVRDIDAAPDDAAARPLVSAYWEAHAWDMALNRRGWKKSPGPKASERSERVRRLLDLDRDEAFADCLLMPRLNSFPRTLTDKVPFGASAAVYLRIDTDKIGKVIKAEVLGAVPQESLGPPMQKFAMSIRMQPDRGWDKTKCSLEMQGLVIGLSFTNGR